MRQVNVDARHVHVQSNEEALLFAGQAAETVVAAQQAASEASAIAAAQSVRADYAEAVARQAQNNAEWI
eukprot:9651011-Karenia_brevis.AAC.1